MKFTTTKAERPHNPVAAIDDDGDLHVFKADGGSLCLTRGGSIFDYDAEEFAEDITVEQYLFAGDSITITF